MLQHDNARHAGNAGNAARPGKKRQKEKYHFRTFYDIRADGRTPYAFINAIRRSAIPCMNQHCKGEAFFCTIPASSLADFQELAEIYQMQLTVREQRSVLGIFRKYRFRFGVPLGILAGIAIIFYYSNTITEIEIRGNSIVADSVILALLEEEQVTVGSWMAAIDMNHCETVLRVRIPEIAWAGIRSSGSRLVIEVTEETPQIEMLHERTPCHIVARYDAQITGVNVYSGQLQYRIGDGVAKGDILVSGIIRDETENSVRFRHAYASITGIYTQDTTFTEPCVVTETRPTGRAVTQRWFRLFNLQIPLQLFRPDYAESDSTESYTAFCFLGYRLPCGMFRRITQEMETSTTERSPEEMQLALQTDIVRYEKNFLQDTDILDRNIVFRTTEDGITCHAVYTVEGEIGMISEFFTTETEQEAEPEKSG